jgi:hypothetical protein
MMWRSVINSCKGHVDDAGIVMAQTAERLPQAAVSDGGASQVRLTVSAACNLFVVLLIDCGPCAGRRSSRW